LKYSFILFLVLLYSSKSSAQSLVYYPFNSQLSISTNPQSVLWVDAKFRTNSYFSSLSTDLSPNISFKRKEKAVFYTGAGVRINYLNLVEKNSPLEGYIIHVGSRLMPFKAYPKVQIAFELGPYISRKADLGVMNSLLGIGYNF
jgi:hypothetical protein